MIISSQQNTTRNDCNNNNHDLEERSYIPCKIKYHGSSNPYSQGYFEREKKEKERKLLYKMNRWLKAQ